MISVDEALRKVLSKIKVLSPVELPILQSLGLVLAEDIISSENIPPFSNAAMDGYAVKAADTKGATKKEPVILKVVEDIAAGHIPHSTLGRGEAVGIMTGALIPEGADAVIMVEDTERLNNEVRVFRQVQEGENIRPVGEDVKAGEVVIRKGKLLNPGDIGMLASLGRATVKVVRRPKVAIISTGDELVELGEPLEPGKIRNSNAYSLAAQIIEAGGEPRIIGLAKDTREDIERKVKDGLNCDILLTSGGVSVGDYDLVKDVLAGLGEIMFWKVAMKPAKPLAFGLIEGRPIFGLPGYPTSSMVSFEQFVRPAILKMSGRKRLKRPEIKATLVETVRKKPGRRNFLRVIVERTDDGYIAKLTGPQASGILKSMSLANGLMVVPEEVTVVKKGEVVTVQMLEEIV
jgi:molybdopterin molybdotransferase